MYLRAANDAYGLYVDNNAFPVTWTGGRLDAVDHGSGILISGGNGNVTVDHVTIAGDFGTGIAVVGRSGGAIVFRNGSPIRIGAASHEAVTLTNSRGAVAFDSPLQIKTKNGRGLIVNRVDRVAVSGGASWIETTNGTALDVRESAVKMIFERISAEGAAPGRLTEAIIVDKVRGRLEITEGSIRNALSYAMRLTQSTDLHVRKLDVSGGGTITSKEECPGDIAFQTNLRCRAALYLRHIERSSFENITISDNAGVGVNANNLTDVTFADVHVTRTGDQSSEPALLIDEARGAISFTRCGFIDGGGGGVVIEQRFNKARITFERCEIAAPERPSAADSLFRARVAGSGRLELQLLNTRFRDNAAAGMRIEAKDSGSVILTLRDSRFDRLGSTALAISAVGRAGVTAIVSGNYVYAPAVRDKPLIDVSLADAATACIDISSSELVGGGSSGIRLAGSQQAKLRIVAGDAHAVSEGNGGIPITIDAPTTYVIGVAGGAWPSFAFGGERDIAVSRLSVGYSATEPEEGALVWLEPADKLLAGDPAFISRDARVTILSSSRAAAQAGRLEGAAIDVVYPALGYQPESYPTYRAWSCREDKHGENISGPVAFRVPVVAGSGLHFLLTRFKANDVAEAADTPITAAGDSVQLSLGSVSGDPKLRRGLYVIAYRDQAGHSGPNWAAVAVTRRDGVVVLAQPERFSHLVLSIDYAS